MTASRYSVALCAPYKSSCFHQSKPKTNHSQVKVVLGFFLFSFHCILFKVSRKRCQFQIKNSYKMALKLRVCRIENTGRSPSGSAANARSRALLSFALFRLPIWQVLERRGAAEPLVYSSTRHSAIFSFGIRFYLKKYLIFAIIIYIYGL